MTILGRNSVTIGGAILLLLLFLISGAISYWQQQFHYFNAAEAGEGECIGYDKVENIIAVTCNASFLDVVQTINDPEILEDLGNGEYILNANLEVADGVTFEMTSNGDGLQYLKIAGANGIVVYGKILINGVTITSWDISSEDVIQQNINGIIRRGYVQFAASEGAQIINSEFGYLGDVELGRRGFDLYGEGASHDMEIRGSKFHDMWMAFYSSGAYNITVDGNEYYNNIKYALDPHTATHDMSITNNYLHHNPIGVICSNSCYNILIEGNLVEHNTHYGIFSRNMHDSIARNNHVYNTTIGIFVSESPNNQIYNNTIEATTSQGIRLQNPELPDDGLTEGNFVYDNTITNSENGIRAASSHDNILESNRFFDIEESEYRLSGGNSSIIIRGQHFDNASISQEDSEIDSYVEIVDSGVIEVIEGERDGEEVEGEGEMYDTDIEPYRRTLSGGDDITVNSS